MSTQTAQSLAQGSGQRTRSCATGLACHRCENHYPLEQAIFACPDCGKGLDVVYDYERAAAPLPRGARRGAAAQHLALRGAAADRRRRRAQARVGKHSGYTPLIRADRLGAELGSAIST